MIIDAITKSLYEHTNVPCAVGDREGIPKYPYFYVDLIELPFERLSINLHSLTYRMAIYYLHDEKSQGTKDNRAASLDVLYKAITALRRITLANGTQVNGEDITTSFVDGLMQIRVTYETVFNDDDREKIFMRRLHLTGGIKDGETNKKD